MKHYTKFAYGSTINVIEFKPSGELFPVVSVGNPNRRQPVTDITHDWCDKQGWHKVAGINLSFFNFTTKPTNLGVDYRDSGFTHVAPNQTDFKAYELAYKNGELIIGDFTQAYFKDEIEGKGSWAVSLSYSLVLNGKIDIRGHEAFDHYKWRHPRTCIGQKKDGTIVLCVIDGRSKKNKGVTAQQSAKIMLDLGCIKAINADGGGSSQMVYQDKLMNTCYEGNRGRAVSNALLIYSKKPLPKLQRKNYPVVRYGSRGDIVRILQKELVKRGYDVGSSGVDGHFGLRTLKSLKDYQLGAGLEDDGVAGPLTWGKITE